MARRRSQIVSAATFAVAVTVLSSGRVSAQQVWTGAQTKVHITDGDYGLPQHLRWATETRFGDGDVGLLFLLFRVGPQWTIGEHFQFVASVVGSTEARDGGDFRPEMRLELEPHVLWSLGVAKFDDRHRLESRWFPSRHTWRYRNQLNVSLDFGETPWIPFVSEEVFVDLSAGLVSESRSKVGLVWRSGSESGLNIGLSYLLRFTRDASAGWGAQHIAVLEASFGPSHPHVWEFDGL